MNNNTSGGGGGGGAVHLRPIHMAGDRCQISHPLFRLRRGGGGGVMQCYKL